MNSFPIVRVPLLAPALVAAPATATGPYSSRSPASAHPTWGLDSCLSCHARTEEDALGTRLSRPCAPLCATCHDDRETHHPTGVCVPGLRVPLLLTNDGKLTCSTCHDVTVPSRRELAWTSQRLVDRLAPRNGPHPTRLLVMKNDRGQLCRSCH